ncbi:MAG: hypothetical protein II803_00355, partial [Firmicutes bacterium]|nr:hypothetical protein [Bacillota bacterium]
AKRGKVEGAAVAGSATQIASAPAGSAAKATGAASRAGTAPRLRLRFEKAEQLFEPAPGEDLMLPLWEIEKHPELLERFGDRLICELPLIWPEDEERTAERLKKLMEKGLSRAYATNIGSVRTALALGLRVSGGPELNILNSEALAEAEALGLEDVCASFEISAAGMGRLAHEKPLAAIGYGRLPLMKLRACPMRGEKGCGACSGLNFMTDRTETDFPLICRERKYSELLNSVPLYAGDRALPADIHIMYFTLESKEECFAIAESYRRGEPFEGRRTGGLYFRKLL